MKLVARALSLSAAAAVLLACSGLTSEEPPPAAVEPAAAPEAPASDVDCFPVTDTPPPEMMAHALKIAQSPHGDMTADRLSVKRLDLDLDGTDEWFIYTDMCYAPGCFGSGYQTSETCGGGYCYVGSGLEVLIPYQVDKEGQALSCEPVFRDLID